jgi:DNA-binding GntR family transcriptional regulator
MKVRRGAYVTEVSEQDLREVYELLSLLESDAAAALCRLADDADLAELAALHKQLENAARPGTGSRDQFFELNEQFHRRMLELAQNRWRVQIVADLRKVMKLNRQGSLFKAGRIEQSLAEHRAIMDALLARDEALAVRRVREHFASGLQAAA